ncbi:hypothetical protein NM1476_2197 [Neisseria meningitidis NM1476]|nr:hypothetical protein NM1476_2197 [Neisseria meningitidis NM1476]
MQTECRFRQRDFIRLRTRQCQKLFEQVFVTPYALLQNGRLPRRIGWERHIVEPFRLKGKGGHRRTQFVCRVGDKPLTVADVFIRTFQKQVDGGYETSDFTGNIVHTQSRQVIDSALFETLRQFADGAHGFVRNPHGQQNHQRQCRQQGQHALPCRIRRQIFTVFVFLHNGNPSLLGRADIDG